MTARSKSPKSTSDKKRNPHAISARKRRAGKMRPKSEKRQNGKNKQSEYLQERDNE